MPDDDGCLTPWDVQSKRVFGTAGVAPTLNRGGGMTTIPCVLVPSGVATLAGDALADGGPDGLGLAWLCVEPLDDVGV